MSEWKYFTPERDGHAPDDWDGVNVECICRSNQRVDVSACPVWFKDTQYRYRPLQDATYEPDLLAQCLRLPQDQREALIEAMQKPQRDWADDVTDRIIAQRFGVEFKEANALTAAAIRSMCRPKEVTYTPAQLDAAIDALEAEKTRYGKLQIFAKVVNEALS